MSATLPARSSVGSSTERPMSPTDTPSSSPGSPRPRLAFIVNNLSPYRIQSHSRVKNEIPQFDVDTYITWEPSRNLWVYDKLPEIGVVTFPDTVAESEFGTLGYYVTDWRTGRRVVEHLERTRPAAVVSCGYGYPSMLRAILWCRRTNTPCLLWSDSNIHGDAKGLKKAIKRVVVSWIVRRISVVLVCGENGERYYAQYGVTPQKMAFFPVEPDYELIERTPQALIDETTSRFNLLPGRRRLLVCGRLVDVKVVDQAIDAFAAVAYKRPNLDLIIVGDGPLKRELQARVPSTLRERVKFVGFFDRQEIVNTFYLSCDVLLHPAKKDAWGLVILEAAAAGLAIITTTAVGAAAEFAQDGVNGRLVRPNDRRALAEAILHVTDESRIDAMKAASKQVSRHFRETHDPVRGLAGALRQLGLLGASPPARAPTR